MCDIGPCKDDQVSFRPVNTILESVGQIVRCMPFRKEKCVMPHSKLSCLTVKKPMINKFMPNPMPQRGSNPDPMSMEIRGEPGDSFYGHVTSIESDSLPASGSINDVRTVIGHFDENGILVVDTNGLEKPSFTLVLSSDQPGLPGEQLDQNGNDIIDNQGAFGTIYDAIGVPDNVQNEKHLYGVNLGGTNFKFVGGEPYVVFRDSCSGELYAVDPSRKVILDSRANVLNFEDFNVPMTNVLAPKFGEANPTRRSSMMDTES